MFRRLMLLRPNKQTDRRTDIKTTTTNPIVTVLENVAAFFETIFGLKIWFMPHHTPATITSQQTSPSTSPPIKQMSYQKKLKIYYFFASVHLDNHRAMTLAL